MEFEKGDLLDLFNRKKIDILVHGCNCFNTMGAGIAKQIKEKYIDAYNADLLTVKGDKNKLGTYSISKINETQYIINAYTQYYYFGKRPLNYEALRNVFKLINENFNNKIIGIPKIGAGLAKGDWNIIKNIIDEETTNNKLICIYL
jgi:O-acetyl-ADP-ribose deacetylase (regulator of RNase III)